MITPVETTIRTHLQANDAVQETIEWAEIVSRLESEPSLPPARTRLPRWGGPLLVPAAAALAVLVLVGGVALLVQLFGGDTKPAIQQPVPHPQVPAMYRAVLESVLAAEIDYAEETSSEEGFVLLTDRPVVYVQDHPDDVNMFDCEGETSSGGAFECVPLPELSDTSGGEIRRDASFTSDGTFPDAVVRQIEAGLSGVNLVFVSDRDTVLGDYVFGGPPVANDGALLRFGHIYESADKRLVTVQCFGCASLENQLLVLELVDDNWTVQVDSAFHGD